MSLWLSVLPVVSWLGGSKKHAFHCDTSLVACDTVIVTSLQIRCFVISTNYSIRQMTRSERNFPKKGTRSFIIQWKRLAPRSYSILIWIRLRIWFFFAGIHDPRLFWGDDMDYADHFHSPIKRRQNRRQKELKKAYGISVTADRPLFNKPSSYV
jgi:hypothetical protein